MFTLNGEWFHGEGLLLIEKKAFACAYFFKVFTNCNGTAKESEVLLKLKPK